MIAPVGSFVLTGQNILLHIECINDNHTGAHSPDTPNTKNTSDDQTDLFILRPRVLREHVGCFEIDRLVVIKHCPHSSGRKNLLSFVCLFVGMLDQHLRFWTTH